MNKTWILGLLALPHASHVMSAQEAPAPLVAGTRVRLVVVDSIDPASGERRFSFPTGRVASIGLGALVIQPEYRVAEQLSDADSLRTSGSCDRRRGCCPEVRTYSYPQPVFTTVFTVAVDMVTRVLSVLPFAGTRIQAVPAPTSVTMPSEVTVAIAALDELHPGEQKMLLLPSISRTLPVSTT